MLCICLSLCEIWTFPVNLLIYLYTEKPYKIVTKIAKLIIPDFLEIIFQSCRLCWEYQNDWRRFKIYFFYN